MVDVAIHDKEEQIAARMRQATLNNRKPETLPPESGVSGKGESAEILAKKIGKSKNDVKAIRAIRLLERGELPERPK